MIDALSKGFFHTLAGSGTLKSLASKYGMRGTGGFARRFIAGESIDEAIAAARELESRGLRLTLDLLGESVTSLDAASAATETYLRIVDRIIQAGITRNISIKLTQFGLDLDRQAAVGNLKRILDAAQKADFFVRIDMENSPYIDVTLETWEALWHEGYRNVGVVLQSALYRSEQDLRRVIALGGRVRLVKGAYREPAEVAHQAKSEVDAAFVRMMQVLLAEGTFPAIATHDEKMIAATRAFARDRGIAADRFEFQMLFGIRRDLQNALHADGYGVRVYLPYGREWFPYFMRRLGERPANVVFVLKGIVGEH